MAQQAFPDEFTTKRGDLVKLFLDTGGEGNVRITDKDGKFKLSYKSTHLPFAVERYHGLRRDNGLACASFEAAKPLIVKVKECAEDDHDWDWLHPNEPDNREIKCAICGKVDVDESEEA